LDSGVINFFCFYGRLELPDQIKMEHDYMHLSIFNEMEKPFQFLGELVGA
jgi:hypothetical protein